MAPRSRGDQARVKRCGKSAPDSGASRNAGKPRSEQGQIEGRLRSSERSAAPGCCPRVGCIDPAGDDGTREMAAARRSRRGTESGLQALLTHSFPLRLARGAYDAARQRPYPPLPIRGEDAANAAGEGTADGARSVPSFPRRQESIRRPSATRATRPHRISRPTTGSTPRSAVSSKTSSNSSAPSSLAMALSIVSWGWCQTRAPTP